ncbi:MAG: hypothetical protein V4719_29995, partial [Planctomycetota bacterium]
FFMHLQSVRVSKFERPTPLPPASVENSQSTISHRAAERVYGSARDWPEDPLAWLDRACK